MSATKDDVSVAAAQKDGMSAPHSPTHSKHKRRTRENNMLGEVYTAGRPPWFRLDGTQLHQCFVIGIAGGSASGKTSVAQYVIKELGVPWVK